MAATAISVRHYTRVERSMGGEGMVYFFIHSNSLFLVQINGLHCVIKRRMPPENKLKVCLHVAYF